jgi:hypothetical protein
LVRLLVVTRILSFSVNEAPVATLDPARAARRELRRRLLTERAAFIGSPALAAATAALAEALCQVVAELEPDCLGLYCAFQSEFNAAAALAADPRCADFPLALPYARRTPKAMEFRRWDGAAPALPTNAASAAATAPSSCPMSSSCPASASPRPAIGSAMAAGTTTAGSPNIGR